MFCYTLALAISDWYGWTVFWWKADLGVFPFSLVHVMRLYYTVKRTGLIMVMVLLRHCESIFYLGWVRRFVLFWFMSLSIQIRIAEELMKSKANQ